MSDEQEKGGIMTVLKISTDRWQTYLGLLEAVLVSLITYIVTLGPEATTKYSSVLIGLGGALAVSRAVKGFFAAGVKAEVQPVGSGQATQPVNVVVPQTDAGIGTKAGQVVPLLLLTGLLAGCASTQGTMLDGRVCSIAGNDTVQQDVDTIVNSYVNDADKARAELYLRTAKLGATALCEAARARQSTKG